MQFFGMIPLASPQEWAERVGEKKFVAGKSAHTLAHAWQNARGFPPSVAAVLARLQLTPARAFIEWRENLDTSQAPSTTDIMIEAYDVMKAPVAIAVEGKCEESFGSRICDWIVGGENDEPSATKSARLDFLNETLGTTLSCDSRIYYQLVHRTASAVLRARAIGASRAVVLVHAFVSPGRSDRQYVAWCEFLHELGVEPHGRNELEGPRALGRSRPIDVSFAWVEDALL